MSGPMYLTRVCEFGADCAVPGAVHMKYLPPPPPPTPKPPAPKLSAQEQQQNVVRNLYKRYMWEEGHDKK